VTGGAGPRPGQRILCGALTKIGGQPGPGALRAPLKTWRNFSPGPRCQGGAPHRLNDLDPVGLVCSRLAQVDGGGMIRLTSATMHPAWVFLVLILEPERPCQRQLRITAPETAVAT
jgi:hypothetical protein